MYIIFTSRFFSLSPFSFLFFLSPNLFRFLFLALYSSFPHSSLTHIHTLASSKTHQSSGHMPAT